MGQPDHSQRILDTSWPVHGNVCRKSEGWGLSPGLQIVASSCLFALLSLHTQQCFHQLPNSQTTVFSVCTFASLHLHPLHSIVLASHTTRAISADLRFLRLSPALIKSGRPSRSAAVRSISLVANHRLSCCSPAVAANGNSKQDVRSAIRSLFQ